MGIKKTLYTFTCNTAEADNMIQSFLSAKNFKQEMPEDGLNVYSYSSLTMNAGLEYGFIGNTLYLFVYLGKHNNSSPLDNSMAGAALKSQCKSLLRLLLERLNELSNGNSTVGITTNGSGLSMVNSVALTSVSSKEQFSKNLSGGNNSYAIIAFIISIVNILITIVGLTLGTFISFGAFIIILTFVLAINGLKSNLKGLSITAIVLTSISTVIFIITTLLNYADLFM